MRSTLDYLSSESPDAELIVVNDGSTDATPAIVREHVESNRARILRRIERLVGAALGQPGPPDLDVELSLVPLSA